MIFIGLKKRTLGIAILILVVILAVVTFYSAVKVSQNESKYQSVLNMTRMFESTNFISFITDEEAQRQSKDIEVYDIRKGEIISKTKITADIQNEVFNYVKTVKSLYTKVMPFPEKGYVLRVPFDPPKTVNIELLNTEGIKSLDQVFVILSDKEAPILLVLDSQRRPFFYTFNASIQPLLDYVKLNTRETSQEDDISQETPTELEKEGEYSETPADLEIEDAPQG